MLNEKEKEFAWDNSEKLDRNNESKKKKSATFKPFGKDGPDISLGTDKVSGKYAVPGTDFCFPPPKGNWDGPSLGLSIPTPVPGLFMTVSGGLSGGIKVPGLEMNLSGEQEKVGEDLSRVKITFLLANNEAITATFGGNIRIGVLGGVPMVAALEAGIEAAAEAKIEIIPQIAAQGEYLIDNEGQLHGSKSEVSASMGAAAGVEASLSLYIAGQIIMFKGDLFKLTLISN